MFTKRERASGKWSEGEGPPISRSFIRRPFIRIPSFTAPLILWHFELAGVGKRLEHPWNGSTTMKSDEFKLSQCQSARVPECQSIGVSEVAFENERI